jgi:histidine ammonia-lyase
VGEVADVIAVEIVTAAQASHLSERPLSPALRRAYALIRDRFAPVGADDVIADHLAEARSLVLAGDLATL